MPVHLHRWQGERRPSLSSATGVLFGNQSDNKPCSLNRYQFLGNLQDSSWILEIPQLEGDSHESESSEANEAKL